MDFCFSQGKICEPKKLGASQRFCTPERTRCSGLHLDSVRPKIGNREKHYGKHGKYLKKLGKQ